MDSIAIDPLGNSVLRNPRPDKTARTFAEGLWCASTLSPDIHVRVGWDGQINRAYNNADEESSGYWQAER